MRLAALAVILVALAPATALAGGRYNAFAREARQQHEARRAAMQERQERAERLQERQREREIDHPSLTDNDDDNRDDDSRASTHKP